MWGSKCVIWHECEPVCDWRVRWVHLCEPMSVHTSMRVWICERMRQCSCMCVSTWIQKECVNISMLVWPHVGMWPVSVNGWCMWEYVCWVCVSNCDGTCFVCICIWLHACVIVYVCVCAWVWVSESECARAFLGVSVIMCVLGCWCVGTSIWMYMQVWAWELVHAWVWMCLCAQLFVSVCVPIWVWISERVYTSVSVLEYYYCVHVRWYSLIVWVFKFVRVLLLGVYKCERMCKYMWL